MSATQEEPIVYSSIKSARDGTGRSSLDLLSLIYPFSQIGLLSARDFATEAAKRRDRSVQHLPMNEQVLEELHRCGVLAPLFRVELAGGTPQHVIDVSQSLTARQVLTTFVGELYRAAAEGRAADPAAEDFARWPTERRRHLWPTVESGYLYSRHQLLGLDVSASFVWKLKPQRSANRTTWHLAEADRPNAPTMTALASWRSLAIILAALDTYYWPFMTHTVSHDLVAWRAARQAFVPSEMLSWLGLSLDQIAAQARDLRIMAAFRDDMGDFYDLIRRARPKSWETLRGDALTAMDCRLAADIFDRFSQELSGITDDPPSLPEPLSHQGLSSRPHSLDAALTDLRLSPYPSLVIGVEGATEYLLVPRVMKLLEIELDRNWIEIVDFGGSTKDLTLLARHAAEPLLGKDYGDSVRLDRPYTRFLVLVDAENKYRTVADRHRQRKSLLDSLSKNLPPKLRRDLYSYALRARTVEIRTWGRLPFEFAHFTDAQLADALLQLARTPHPGGRAALIAQINQERFSSSPDIGDIRWPGRGPISKLSLADKTWPLLEARIQRAIQRGHRGPPIMQAVLRAYEMASSSVRSTTVLRRR